MPRDADGGAPVQVGGPGGPRVTPHRLAPACLAWCGARRCAPSCRRLRPGMDRDSGAGRDKPCTAMYLCRYSRVPECQSTVERQDANTLAHDTSPGLASQSRTRPEDVPLVLPIEVASILSNASPRSCPGPDSVPYSEWNAIHEAAPALIPGIMSTCLQFGFHPSCLKLSNGFVLSESGKADYSTPSSFRVIVLLDIFSRIVEKLV